MANTNNNKNHTVTSNIEHTIKLANKRIEEFQADLAKDPMYAIEWRIEEVTNAAAVIKVFSEALGHLTVRECSIKDVEDECMRNILRFARYAQAESPVKAMTTAATLQAWSKLLGLVTGK